MKRHVSSWIVLWCLTLTSAIAHAGEPAELKLTGDWAVQVTVPAAGNQPAVTTDLTVAAAPVLIVSGEKYDQLQNFNPKGPGYACGERLRGIRNKELGTRYLLDPESVIVRAGPKETDRTYIRGEDYELEPTWGCFGRLPDGHIPADQPVYASYRHGLMRLDTIVLTAAGKVEYRAGEPQTCCVAAPELQAGERRLANIWLPGRATKLTEDNLFPILETGYPEATATSPSIAEQLIPKAMAKLRAGEPLRILAWGDSVTESTYLPDRSTNSWQNQFVTRLQKRFPQAKIELVTEAWGGRNTHSYLAVPPGQEHNYAEKVLSAKPDLVISEFVNDAGLSVDAVESLYSKTLQDFQGIGAEWIILTPHYTRPDWMGLTSERDIDNDPRPYVTGLRQFGEKHQVAIADASKRYGRLWRQGVPYNSLMTNAINHPDARGMTIFADALMALFPEK